MSWLRFFLSRTFFLHLTIILVLGSSLVYLVITSLSRLTRHNELIEIPDLENKNISEAIHILDSLGLKHAIADSSKFHVDYKPNSIIRYIPGKNAKVKSGRTISLIVNKHHFKKVKFPKIMEQSFREVKINFKIIGLDLGNISYVPYIAKDVVLEARFKGELVKEGDLLPRYAKIDLTLGKGLGKKEIKMPDLMIMTYYEAMAEIKKDSFNVGLIKFDEEVTDSASAFVYFQDPKPKRFIHRAAFVDLWFTQDEKKLEEKYLRRKKIEETTNDDSDTIAVDADF